MFVESEMDSSQRHPEIIRQVFLQAESACNAWYRLYTRRGHTPEGVRSQLLTFPRMSEELDLNPLPVQQLFEELQPRSWHTNSLTTEFLAFVPLQPPLAVMDFAKHIKKLNVSIVET